MFHCCYFFPRAVQVCSFYFMLHLLLLCNRSWQERMQKSEERIMEEAKLLEVGVFGVLKILMLLSDSLKLYSKL